MDRFREIESFIAVATEGSFNGAARRLAVSPPIVTRLINALEDRLGATLFVRTTRRLSLTEAGERFLDAAVPLLDDLLQAEAAASGLHKSVSGELRITAPVLFGEKIIAPLLREFLDDHPLIKARALFVDRVVHLLEEGIDVAVRLTDLPDSSLSAIKVGNVRRIVVASPSYVAMHGRPDLPDELCDHTLITIAMLEKPTSWAFQRGGKTQTIQVSPRLSVNTVRSAIDAALAGWGITRALSYQVNDHLKSGDLLELLPGFDDRITPIHLVHQEGLNASAKTRAFLEFATQRLRSKAPSLIAELHC